MKTKITSILWITAVFIIFLCFTLLVRGPAPRVHGDYMSDVALMRFFKGGIFSALVMDRSPVMDYSIPYGGWPPLQMIIQAMWAATGIDLTTSRFLTGLTASLVFAFVSVKVLRKLVDTDQDIVVATALISPMIVFFSWFAMSHVLIACSAVLGLWLVQKNIESESCLMALNIGMGFILGLTDWFTYGLVPALAVTTWYVKRHPDKFPSIPVQSLPKIVFSIACGFILAFISYKLIEYHVVAQPDVLFSAGAGHTKAKLLLRMMPSLHKISYAMFFSCVRLLITFLPVLIIVKIAGVRGIWRKLQKQRATTHFILIIAFLNPIFFTLLFTGQVSPSNHRMQTLSFLTPALLLLGVLLSNVKIGYLRKGVIVAFLSIITLYATAGYRIVPDSLLIQDSLVQYTSPLPPGNYEVIPKQSKLSLFKILKSANNQIMTYPGCDQRIVNLNPFHKSWNDIRMYGQAINKYTKPNEVILFFGSHIPGFRYHTGRVMVNIANLKNFKRRMMQFEFRAPTVLLVPQSGMSTRHMDMIRDMGTFHATKVEGTPYTIIRFEKNERRDLGVSAIDSNRRSSLHN